MAAGTTHAGTTIPTVPRGHIKVSDYSALGEEKREGGGRREGGICRGSHNAPRLTRPLEQVHPHKHHTVQKGSPQLNLSRVNKWLKLVKKCLSEDSLGVTWTKSQLFEQVSSNFSNQ